MELSWNDVAKRIVEIVASAGGVGVIVIGVVKAFSGIISNCLLKKISLKYDKEFERYKSLLGNKTYVSKVRFDAEFGIYQKLSKSFFEMAKNITFLIPMGFSDSYTDKEAQSMYQNTLYERAMTTTETAQDILYESSPFISESIFEKYKELLELCHTQIIVYEMWRTNGASGRFKDEDYLRSETITKKLRSLNNDVRMYLSELEVKW